MSNLLRTTLFRPTTIRILPLSATPTTTRLPLVATTAIRSFHSTPPTSLPYKDDMDRESLKPKAHESTQSGTDDETASEHSQAAFDPSTTSPEASGNQAAKGAAQQGKGNNPLEASPANHGFARGGKLGEESEAKKEDKEGKSRRSGGGDAPKAGGKGN